MDHNGAWNGLACHDSTGGLIIKMHKWCTECCGLKPPGEVCDGKKKLDTIPDPSDQGANLKGPQRGKEYTIGGKKPVQLLLTISCIALHTLISLTLLP